MSLLSMEDAVHRDLNPPKSLGKDAIIVANASMAEIARRNFEAERFHLLYPGMCPAGMRFNNVYVSSGTYTFLTRGNPRSKAWVEEQVRSRLIEGGQIIVLP